MRGREGTASLEERVERLEAGLEEQSLKLSYALRRMERGSGDEETALSRTEPAEVSGPADFAAATGRNIARPEVHEERIGLEKRRTERDEGDTFPVFAELYRLRSWEWWLGKVGIGLLLFGVAFLFKFSVDQGWITPPVRVGTGLVIGMILLFLGLRVYEDRRSFSQVLLGGGIGTLYITGYAAHGLFSLVSWPTAFAFMSAVTLLAFVLAIRQSAAALSVIGATGGLSTPFVLYTYDGSVAGLVLHTCVILSGAVAVYLFKGWRSLLVSAFVGGWLVFLIGAVDVGFVPGRESFGRPALQIGVAFGWLVFWLAPIIRDVLHSRSPERWPLPESGAISRIFIGGEGISFGAVHAHFLSITTPLISLAITHSLWNFEARTFGLIALGGAAAYALAALGLRRVEDDGMMPYVQSLVALLLGTLALVTILEGNVLFLALAVEAAVLHLIAKKFPDKVAAVGGHSLFVVVGLWFSSRVFFDGVVDSGYLFDPAEAATQLAAITLAFLASFLLPATPSLAYRLSAHAALLAWLWSVLGALPNGEVWTTISWGLCGVTLVVAGLRRNLALPMRGGMATLFLVVGKLFLVDLIWVETIWRILLFLGFGGLFLTLSYYLQSFWKPEDHPGERHSGERHTA